jgi:hypothetical protein
MFLYGNFIVSIQIFQMMTSERQALMGKRNEVFRSTINKPLSVQSGPVMPEQIISVFFQNLGRLGQSKPHPHRHKHTDMHDHK